MIGTELLQGGGHIHPGFDHGTHPIIGSASKRVVEPPVLIVDIIPDPRA